MALKGSKFWNQSIVVGHFNTAMCQKEKRGGNIVKNTLRDWMEDLISLEDLVDIKLSKGRFTWSNKRLGPSHIVLD
jgi:hypothetical protein